MSTALTPSATACGGKYLTFYLGAEEYGVAILHVQEIISMQPITRVPRTPAFMRGVINLRGRVIPIVDLRERFGMPPVDDAAAGDPHADARAAALRCIIVVEVQAQHQGGDAGRARPVPMGIVVDRVSEVAAVDAAQIADPPSFGTSVRTDFLLGMAMSKGGAEAGEATKHAPGSRPPADAGRVRLLLDINRVLAAEELTELTSAAA